MLCGSVWVMKVSVQSVPLQSAANGWTSRGLQGFSKGPKGRYLYHPSRPRYRRLEGDPLLAPSQHLPAPPSTYSGYNALVCASRVPTSPAPRQDNMETGATAARSGTWAQDRVSWKDPRLWRASMDNFEYCVGSNLLESVSYLGNQPMDYSSRNCLCQIFQLLK